MVCPVRTRAPVIKAPLPASSDMLWFPLGVCAGLAVWLGFLFQLGPFERRARWRLAAERKRDGDTGVLEV